MKQLTLSERKTLAIHAKNRLLSLRDIQKLMNRSLSTLSQELRRNNMNRYEYSPHKAHNDAITKQANHAKTPKLRQYPELRNVIEKRLKAGQTPEMIAGDLKRLKQPYVCHETIYQACYHGEITNEGKPWYKLLPWRKNKGIRVPHGSRKNRIKIPDRTSIKHRPEYINNRSQFGHWEADLIQGAGHSGFIMVATERQTRYSVAVLMKSKKADEMHDALRVLLDFGADAVKSITFDNGSENVAHVDLKKDIAGLETFFCDPYCSWQKGSTERINRDYRQKFPKSLRFDNIQQKDVELASIWRNNRPLKVLNFRSPASLFMRSVYS